ncbi:hypothetical protein [Mucilaginibacter arboris]|uniref:Uncharacterized protein n=1 Tax=Mucilaginibacter arboris TaxID=2682090 RepID=A0A7K1SZ57_9SPHI|nr:hypothetical protein [Mucilaginibacter arboris]MVN22538.1 hypothetical protein [Mucilaginibacter arboris]
MRKKLVGLLVFVFFTVAVSAQQPEQSSNQTKFKNYEDSLKTLGSTFINNENDLERKNANYQFIRTLVSALKIPGSYNYAFDSLKAVSLLYAPDNQFRLFTWHVMNEDGSFRYYGTIQLNTGGALKMFPLTDFSPFIKNPEDSTFTAQHWLGAQYYKIIKEGKESPYYVLLGWKGNNVKTTKKVIEVLSFKNNAPVFGLPVFEGNQKTRKRIVFEYSRQASMLLRYVPEKQLIVFDHLAPPDPKTKADFSFYGPDLTYDGYQLKNGKWNFVSNLDMRNIPESGGDTEIEDPKKQALRDRASIPVRRNN